MNTKKIISPLIFIAVILISTGFTQIKFIEDTEQGTLSLREDKTNILTYRFGDQLPEGIESKYTRSGYIHPLYSLDGKILTADFPPDHPHHHGIFWTWPKVKVRGFDTQTWHPDSPLLRQHFVRWLKREQVNKTAVLRIENAWILDGREKVAQEIVFLKIHPVEGPGRTIDVELTFEAVGGTLELQGAPDQNKGYGGLCLRGAAVLQDAVMTTDKGTLDQDATNMKFRWADLSTRELGVAIFAAPKHPGFPVTWLIRSSYAGILNPSWPGLKPIVLKPGQPAHLSYRIYIHRGDVRSGKVQQAYQEYLSEQYQ